jgi:hypothetical protein
MKSTQAMRMRCRELSKPDRDDYDRAVICILDDFEALQAWVEELEAAREIDLRECAAQLDQNTATMDLARARIEELEAALAAVNSLPDAWRNEARLSENHSVDDVYLRCADELRAALDKDAGK